jgi:hypothetical protein
MRPTCSAANKVVFFATILDCKERCLTWNKIMSHLIASKDASMKTFPCLSVHNFISLHSILPQYCSATHRSLAHHQLTNNNINSTTDTLMRSGRKGYVPLDELRGHGQHQPSHDWSRKWEVQLTCYQCGMYHYHEASTLTILLHIEDFTWEYHSKHPIINEKKFAWWWTEMWLYKTRLKKAHECAQSLQIHVPCLLKPQACMRSNQWPTSESWLLERTPTVQNPQ